jgi:LacI family transcriptional regulator
MATRMKDIAADLGVSLMTVSKALRLHSDISEETRERVLQRARELHYHPNLIARGLVTRKSYLVGVVIPDLMHSFFAEVAKGLSQRLSPHGYQAVLTDSDDDPELETRQIEALLTRHVDGLVIASTQDDWQSRMPDALRAGTVPYVLVDRLPENMEGLLFVGTRDEELGSLATEHLIQQGCRLVAHISGPATPNSRQRQQGYQQALVKHGRRVDPAYSVVGGSDNKTGYRAARQLLELKHPPDGIFCYSDPVAAGAMKAVLDAGLRVPQDVAIVGAGNIHHSDLLCVPLSTIDQDSSKIGETAAEFLLEAFESKGAPVCRTVLLSPRLVVRESSRRTGRASGY